MLCSLANLDQGNLSTIQDLEKQAGVTVLAFSCQDLEAAPLDDSTLKELQSLEKKLGLSLVAVKV
ncbi:MAG: hypothetical protein K9K66_01325 [Desulfarculaceae bacterium]|nr:hypothetical protein [Desulfarculaceae bacterium]MCF8072354.1 hypothetical protein [Desulfarculaceae bacterium]MCF8100275.1 hypothetical protein [Desulfarculaceae bacterium]MCF8116152.1 hypothetical protein [Desulfarculaceae bacterium]